MTTPANPPLTMKALAQRLQYVEQAQASQEGRLSDLAGRVTVLDSKQLDVRLRGLSLLERLAGARKAVAAFLLPIAAGLGAAMQDATPGGSGVTRGELLAIGAAALATSGVVYGIPNDKPKADESGG